MERKPEESRIGGLFRRGRFVFVFVVLVVVILLTADLFATVWSYDSGLRLTDGHLARMTGAALGAGWASWWIAGRWARGLLRVTMAYAVAFAAATLYLNLVVGFPLAWVWD